MCPLFFDERSFDKPLAARRRHARPIVDGDAHALHRGVR